MSLVCYLHPSSSAQDRCAVCRRTICPACVVAGRRATLCRSCAEKMTHERRRMRFRVALVAAVAIAGLAAVASIADEGAGCAAVRSAALR